MLALEGCVCNARPGWISASPGASARSRLTTRLRVKVTAAVTAMNRAMSEVATEHDRPQRPLAAGASRRHRRCRHARAQRVAALEPVDDLERGPGPGPPWRIIGLAPGRSGACVKHWIALQSIEFRAAVKVVAIDPSEPYAAGIRTALPQARIVLDHFHMVLFVNTTLTDVRQRAAHEQHDRRGRKVDRRGRTDGCCSALVTNWAPGPWPASRQSWTAMTRPFRSAPRGPSRSCYVNSSRATARPGFTALAPRTGARPSWPLAWTRTAREDPPGRDGPALAAPDRRVPPARRNERPHRGLQPGHQGHQTRRLRVHQPDQLRKGHHVAHRDPTGPNRY